MEVSVDIKRKDCITDFIAAWKQWDEDNSFNAFANKEWGRRLDEAGYYGVEAGRQSIEHEWQNIHKWCEDHFGGTHFIWTGSTFWFETERNAILFALRWS